MLFQLMSLQIQLRSKDDMFILQAFPLQTNVMILPVMGGQSFEVHVILWRPDSQLLTDTASLMLAATMLIKLIITIEPLVAKSADRVTLESTLIHGSRVVVPFPHVLRQLGISVEFMLMREDFLVPRAQITNLLMMYTLNVSMQIRPAQAGNITVSIWAIVSQENQSVVSNAIILVSNANIVITARNICFRELLIAFRSIVGENHNWSWCLVLC